MNLIDFPCSPTWAAAYAEQGLTPPLPAGFPVDRPSVARFAPLPVRDLNEAEWKNGQGAALLQLIGWVQLMANTETPDVWHNHLPLPLPLPLPGPRTPAESVPDLSAPPTPARPRYTAPAQRNPPKPQPVPPVLPAPAGATAALRPAPKLEGKWRHT